MKQGFAVQLVKGWVVVKNTGADLDTYAYETREEAVREARALHRLDRQHITGIYETWLAISDNKLCLVWSVEEDGISSIESILDGDYVSDEELKDIMESGRGF